MLQSPSVSKIISYQPSKDTLFAEFSLVFHYRIQSVNPETNSLEGKRSKEKIVGSDANS